MKPKEIGAYEAKTRLSELLERVDKGQVYVITRRGRPVAELRPVQGRSRLLFGTDRGRIRIADDFDAPVPDMGESTQ